jgi:hypothetical protein
VKTNCGVLILNKIFLITLIFSSASVNAAWTTLVCIKPDDKFSISIEFEENLKLIKVNDMAPVFSNISASFITFNHKPFNIEYFYNINRLNGVMSIKQVDTGTWLSALQCSLARRQF